MHQPHLPSMEDKPVEPLHPEIEVDLSGEDGNTFIMVSCTRTALKRSSVPETDCVEFFNDALSGDRDHAIQTIMKWVNVS